MHHDQMTSAISSVNMMYIPSNFVGLRVFMSVPACQR